MKLHDLKIDFTAQLSEIYPQTEIDTFFFYLIEEYLDFQRIDVLMKADFEITDSKQILFNSAIQRLKKQEPIQYILGNTEFYGFPFLVNKNTLIPRPETEQLVEWILEDISDIKNSQHSQYDEVLKPRSILEIGTGTGCIPISLKKHLADFDISAIDVSKEALKIAKENAKQNTVEINFIAQDILKAENLNFISSSNSSDICFDIIVSNPPYVRELEKAEIKNNVLENEPHLALFVSDDNPLIFYNKIADLAKLHLTKNGLLFFEINQYLAKETVAMLAEKGFKNIELKKDFVGNDRMIKASLF
ncbi:peptide chain release factor N(5)-glutamine methyltransferase [Tenacibaculum finnmarkense]|uniref:peptide chain release factor N(5)-glutamine methyltransferase n=1 Tax=Tenacibaculum finnmarkense TaxID=2781243 RepID=UPI001EFA672A|nr:peptide chain release factor N(5)-glutamine methyltransferase [Tenacibaculum finnmarkense]MCG8893323.1 peptide chain release factor N(5)-glutamine methyltransferase [Tenacibaculum finnmarkense]MCG8901757.1 peptide chain release factor N(5)-glutamine methyltransferase [Tenacibaculum finnmarkense]